jgi:glutamyl-tRNA reductase
MQIGVLSINHHKAPLDVRARLAFSQAHLSQVLGDFLASARQETHEPISEVLGISTCNRTEIYGAGPHWHPEQLLHWLCSDRHVPVSEIQAYADVWQDRLAVTHLFQLACGLDSMVLGETQILGQMKTAWRSACQEKTIGPVLQALCQRAFTVAKQVRSQTDIGTHRVSLGSIAVRLALQVFESLSELRVLFVGAGDMVTLACTHFAQQNPVQMVISNRSPGRAQILMDRFKLSFIPLADIPSQLHQFDVVVTGTSSTLPLIGLGAVQHATKLRRHRPILMIDLAVPRDIEPEVRQLPDVYLYTVDDLGRMAQSHQELRQAGALEAQVLIDQAAAVFWQEWQSHRHRREALQAWQSHAKGLQQAQVDWATRQWAQGKPLEDILPQMAQRLTQQFQHRLLAALRSPSESERDLAIRALHTFFTP